MINLKNIPNFLTLIRILLIPIIIIFIEIDNYFYRWLALSFYIIACLSDFFDGYLARKLNVVSNFGKIVDPVADKMLIIGTLFALGTENFFNYYYTFIPAFLIILREIFITGLREQVSKDNINLTITTLAKWKTTIQLISCSSYLIWRSDQFIFESLTIEYICVILLWIAAFITIITCYDYLKKVWEFL